MKRRLVAAIMGVALVALVLFALPLGVVMSRTYRDEALLRLQRDAFAATRQIDLGGPQDPLELPTLRGGQLAVYGRAGVRLAGRGPQRADGPVLEALKRARPVARINSRELIVAVPLLVGERPVGALRAERPAAAALGGQRRALVLVLAAALAVLAAAGLLALVVGSRLARPLERIAAAARRLGEGDFAVRAPRSPVPELRDVAAAIDAAAARLAELVARERAFSSDVAHQLKTPLAALRLELEALAMSDRQGELSSALAQVDRLEETVETLLAAARDAHRSSARTSVQQVLAEIEREWRGLFAAQGRPLVVRSSADGEVITAPASVVREIVNVLLDNALRHGAGAVELRASLRGEMVRLEVRDQGPGVRGDASAIFERRAGARAGHGIGLALARSLAQAEGGELALTRPTPPVFTLELPTRRSV